LNELLGATSAAEVVVTPNGNDGHYQCDQSNSLNVWGDLEELAPQAWDQQAGRNGQQASTKADEASPKVELPRI
jgi:hypothetical protein